MHRAVRSEMKAANLRKVVVLRFPPLLMGEIFNKKLREFIERTIVEQQNFGLLTARPNQKRRILVFSTHKKRTFAGLGLKINKAKNARYDEMEVGGEHVPTHT